MTTMTFGYKIALIVSVFKVNLCECLCILCKFMTSIKASLCIVDTQRVVSISVGHLLVTNDVNALTAFHTILLQGVPILT